MRFKSGRFTVHLLGAPPDSAWSNFIEPEDCGGTHEERGMRLTDWSNPVAAPRALSSALVRGRVLAPPTGGSLNIYNESYILCLPVGTGTEAKTKKVRNIQTPKID